MIRINYVLCLSYEPVYLALYLSYIGENVIVLTFNDNVFRFCVDMGIECKCFRRVLYVKPFSFVSNIKSFFENEIDIVNKDCRFFFTSYAKTLEGIIFARLFKKFGCKVFYKNSIGIDWWKDYKYKPFFIKGIISKIIFKYFFKIPIVFYAMDKSKPAFGVTEKWIKNNFDVYKNDISFDNIMKDVVIRGI